MWNGVFLKEPEDFDGTNFHHLNLRGPVFSGFFVVKTHKKLGGGFKYLLFSPLGGEDSHFD